MVPGQKPPADSGQEWFGGFPSCIAKTSFHTLGLNCFPRSTRPYAWQRSVNLLPLYVCAIGMSRAKNIRRPTIRFIVCDEPTSNQVDFTARRSFIFCQPILCLAKRR